MKNAIVQILRKKINIKNKKVFLCIGTNNCVGDSLGPRVGEILYSKISSKDILVVGTKNKNVSYGNIYRNLNKIYKEINNPYIIVIDSALSNREYVGNIIINNTSVRIGRALEKSDYNIGNISIKGIVGENKNNKIENFKTLNNVSERLIEELSHNISKQIITSL